MDDSVQAALVKWPHVPDVYGWLRLDARGQWWIKNQPLNHAGMCAFFARNYQCDARGAWYVQNGAQRVFVDLDAAPYVAWCFDGVWQVEPGRQTITLRALYWCEDDALYLEFAPEHDVSVVRLAQVDDRILATVCAALAYADGTVVTTLSYAELAVSGMAVWYTSAAVGISLPVYPLCLSALTFLRMPR